MTINLNGDQVAQSLQYLTMVKEGDYVDVADNGEVLRPPYPCSYTSGVWRSVSGNHGSNLGAIQKLYDSAFNEHSQSRDSAVLELVARSLTGLRALERSYKARNNDHVVASLVKVSTSVSKKLDARVKSLLTTKFSVDQACTDTEAKKLALLAMSYLKDSELFENSHTTYDFTKERCASLIDVKPALKPLALGLIGIRQVVDSHKNLNTDAVSQISLYDNQPGSDLKMKVLEVLQNKILMYISETVTLKPEEVKFLRDLANRLASVTDSLSKVLTQENNESLIDSDQQIKTFVQKRLSCLGKARRDKKIYPGCMIPAGFQSNELFYLAPMTLVCDGSDKYRIFLHDAGPHQISESASWLPKLSMRGQTTRQYGPFTKKEVEDIAVKAVKMLLLKSSESTDTCKGYYHNLFASTKLKETNGLPERNHSQDNNCQMHNLMEWLIFSMQRFNMVDVANEFLAYDPYHTGKLHSYQTVTQATGFALNPDRFKLEVSSA